MTLLQRKMGHALSGLPLGRALLRTFFLPFSFLSVSFRPFGQRAAPSCVSWTFSLQDDLPPLIDRRHPWREEFDFGTPVPHQMSCMKKRITFRRKDLIQPWACNYAFGISLSLSLFSSSKWIVLERSSCPGVLKQMECRWGWEAACFIFFSFIVPFHWLMTDLWLFAIIYDKMEQS